ncbi:hypothetical protein [Kribbella deserti]|uniref:Uncharacterized protein n=1 Tax=Kribbella deserti TaxID=1926257 RepID=A0ABV6QE27_9ACTN
MTATLTVPSDTAITKASAQPDWTFTTNPEALRAIEHAAYSIAFSPKYRDAIQAQDLHQEALIMVATNPELHGPIATGHIGTMHSRLKHDLINHCATPARRQTLTVSYEQLWESYNE